MSDDEWGGMDWDERTEFAVMNIVNGNLTDALNFIMHDGDVRADSVIMALLVAQRMIHESSYDTTSAITVNVVINRLIRLITTWETR